MNNANNIYLQANKEIERITEILDDSSKKFARLYSECSSERLLEYANILQKSSKWLGEVQK